MGNNAAFTAFEAVVIATYNRGVLDKELLSEFMEQYRGVDIDSGGMVGTLAKDSLDCVEVVIKLFGKSLPPRPQLPENHRMWTKDQYDQNEQWYDAYWNVFYAITDEFGWR